MLAIEPQLIAKLPAAQRAPWALFATRSAGCLALTTGSKVISSLHTGVRPGPRPPEHTCSPSLGEKHV